MLILGIETSCDETAAAVVQDGRKILSNIVSSQVKLHAPHGGVVPELASREHIKNIIPVIQEALRQARVSGKDLDAIAVTIGPGLIPALMIGVDTARVLAFAWDKPIIGVNHIEGHIYSIKLKIQSSKSKGPKIALPALCLTVSGGHTKLILVEDWGKYQVIGDTLDDACGEAFDKVAKLLNLGYPGGPLIEQMARAGNSQAFTFPRPMLGQDNFDFSFSGLKTAVLYEVRRLGTKALNNKIVQDLCASFQQAVCDVLIKKTDRAVQQYNVKSILLAGGVAANRILQGSFKKKFQRDAQLFITRFPTDNAAMIAAAACNRAIKKDYDDWRSLQARANLEI